MGRKIIAVDDSEVVRELVSATLMEFGYDDVDTFSDPHEALEALSAPGARGDLILLDIMMPGMDGIELCARLRQLEAWRDVPIVMLTSRTDKGSLSRAFLAGANDYLTKPFDNIEFQARLKAQLRLKAELDRRHVKQAEDGSARRGRKQRSHLPGLLGDQHTLLNALAIVEDGAPLAVFALSIDALTVNATDFSPAEQTRIIVAVAEALSVIDLPVGSIFVHWDQETFCGATLGRDGPQMVARLEQMSAELQEALGQLGDELKGAETTVSIALAIGGRGESASDVLGNTFKALEHMQKTDRGGVHVAGAHDPSI